MESVTEEELRRRRRSEELRACAVQKNLNVVKKKK
jgi:hypothetical protein